MERCTYRWDDNIKMDTKKSVGGVNWIYLTQIEDRWRALVNRAMNQRVPQKEENI
jgi:hypothetical protein